MFFQDHFDEKIELYFTKGFPPPKKCKTWKATRQMFIALSRPLMTARS